MTDYATASAFDPAAEELVADARVRTEQSLDRRERLVFWTSALGFLAVAVPLALLASPAHLPPTGVVFLLVASYAVAGRVRFESGPGLAVATQMVFVEMLFVLPPAQVPLWAALGAVCTELPEYVLGIRPLERAVIPLASSWSALAPALVFVAGGSPDASFHPHTLLVLAIAVVAQFAVDFAVSGLQGLGFGIHPRELAAGAGWVVSIDLALTPLGLAAAIAAEHSQAALLMPLPLLFVIGISSRERQRRIDQALELSSAYRGTAFLLGDVVEADNEYTGAHSRDVLDLVLSVADELGVDPRQRRDAEFVALLHDVGKIRLPDGIVDKPGPLSSDERALVKMHTVEGQRLLERVGGRLTGVGRIVRSCHEHWDGRGYPDGLAGEEIPLVARIVACCDAFSAMTTNRPYRGARTVESALAELHACAGTQFDPDVVAVLTDLIRGGRAGLGRKPELVVLPGSAVAATR